MSPERERNEPTKPPGGTVAGALVARLAGNPNDEDAKREFAEVEDRIDHAAAELWGITEAELEEIRQALNIL